PSMAKLVAQNTRLRELPTLPATDVYVGPLHDGLNAAEWSPAAAQRAEHSLVIVSIVWGALRPSDRIPPYRMRAWASLESIGRLEPVWRGVLPGLFARLAGDGLVVDIRSGSYDALGKPAGIGDRTIDVRVA